MKRTWFYLNTPLAVFLIVMVPICGLMTFALLMPHRTGIRVSAAVVLGFSVHATLRGYVRRLSIDESGATFHRLAGRMTLAWRDVRRIDRYIPGGGVNGTKYVFITSADHAPAGKWEIDSQAFQLQDRPGLLDALREAWRTARNC